MTTPTPLTKENIFPSEDNIRDLELEANAVKTVLCTDVWLAVQWLRSALCYCATKPKKLGECLHCVAIDSAFGACRPELITIKPTGLSEAENHKLTEYKKGREVPKADTDPTFSKKEVKL